LWAKFVSLNTDNNPMLKSKIQDLAKAYLPQAIATRRHLHANPELSYQEVETGKFIAARLTELGIAHVHGVAENGVVALIKGRNPDKKTVALRADMDALPIFEKNDIAYKSKNEGVMHACGHDAHSASLLGAARILHELRDEFEGTIKLIFQPAEEKLPGGASIMIREGVLQNPEPTVIIGQHVHPPMQAGKIGMRAGNYMASADEIYVTIRGKGGHGALPQDCIDPIAIMAQMITALQQIVSRNAPPTIPSVLTFGKIIANGATNIIPDEVYMEGTFRTFDENWRTTAHEKMVKLAEGLAQSMGATCDFNIVKGYPVLKNDEALTARTFAHAQHYLGEENVEELPIRMTAEDFAYYSHQIPAVFYRLGTGNAALGTNSPLHTATFNIDESALEIGMGLFAYLAVQELL
jgi:amidohydrolase